MARRKEDSARAISQAAILPFRRMTDGTTQILLITSRDTGRWVIPKGNMTASQTAHGTAVQEALEEAGVRGVTSDRTIGHYDYRKYRGRDHWDLAHVTVFAMEVTVTLDDWKEAAQRQRRWFAQAKAARRVAEKQLRTLIANFTGG